MPLSRATFVTSVVLVCACTGGDAPAAAGVDAGDERDTGAIDDVDAGSASRPPVTQTLELTTGDFPVPAGTERQICAYRRYTGTEPLDIVGFRADMPAGSHHFNFFYIDPEAAAGIPEGQGSCSYDQYPVYIGGSQWTHVEQALPDGVALPVPPGAMFRLESHFVNATSSMKTGRTDVHLDAIAPSDVAHFAGVYFNVMNDMVLQPREEVTFRASCPTRAGTNVFLMTSHSHQRTLDFTIDLVDDASGETRRVYDNDDWEHPAIGEMSPPLVLGAGQSFAWQCHYLNDRDEVVTEGGSAERNEMCIMAAFYWPAPRGTIPYCFRTAERVP